MNNVAEIDLILFSLGTAKLIWELKVEALRTETRRPFFAYTVYIFRISTDSQVWVIEKTWSDFKVTRMHTASTRWLL